MFKNTAQSFKCQISPARPSAGLKYQSPPYRELHFCPHSGYRVPMDTVHPGLRPHGMLTQTHERTQTDRATTGPFLTIDREVDNRHLLPPVPSALCAVCGSEMAFCTRASGWGGWGGVGGGAGICLNPLSAGSSDRQLLPHLLPCWTCAWRLSAAHLPSLHSTCLSPPPPSVPLCVSYANTTHAPLANTVHIWPASTRCSTQPWPHPLAVKCKRYSRSCYCVFMRDSKGFR